MRLRNQNSLDPAKDYEGNLDQRHPCTSQYVKSNNSPNTNDPIFEVLKYATNNSMKYEDAFEKCEDQLESSGIVQRSVPDLGKSWLRAVDKIIELDRMARGSSLSHTMIKDHITNLVINLSAEENRRKKALAEVAIVAVYGKKPGRFDYDRDIDTIDKDDRERIEDYCGIGHSKKKEDKEEEEENAAEKIETIEKPINTTENDTVDEFNTTKFWRNRQVFAAWTTLMINEEKESARPLLESSINNKSQCNKLLDLIDETTSSDELIRRASSQEDISLTRPQEMSLRETQQEFNQNGMEGVIRRFTDRSIEHVEDSEGVVAESSFDW